MKIPFASVPLFVAFFVAFAGCSDKESQEAVALRKGSIKMVGTAFRQFAKEQQRSPASVDELVEYIQAFVSAAEKFSHEAVRRLEEREIVVYWGSELLDDDQENEEYVLAYEAGVPRTGGYLVSGGGRVMLVTPGSFKDFKEYPQPAQ